MKINIEKIIIMQCGKYDQMKEDTKDSRKTKGRASTPALKVFQSVLYVTEGRTVHSLSCQ